MALDTLNNGDSGLEARTKINAAIAAVDSGTIIRATGILQAYAMGGVGSQPPPALSLTFADTGGAPPDIVITLLVNSVTYLFAFYAEDPGGDFNAWVDTSAMTSTADYAAWLLNNIRNYSDALTPAMPSGPLTIQLTNSGTGSEASLSGYASDGCTFTGGGVGTDPPPPGGESSEVVLAAGNGTKKIKMLTSYSNSNIEGGVSVALYLRSPANVDTQLSSPVNANTQGIFIPAPGIAEIWQTGFNAGESLVAKITPDSIAYLPMDASSCSVGATFEQS